MINTLPTQKLNTKLGLVLLALFSVLLGSLTLTGSAKADPFEMEITNSRLNLSALFKNEEVIPAPQSAGTPESPIPLPNLSQINPADITGPSADPTDWPGSFTPVACGTLVTYGYYVATDPDGNVINNITGSPTGNHIALPNTGTVQTGKVQTGPATATPAASDVKTYQVTTNGPTLNPLGFCQNPTTGTISGDVDEEGNISIQPSDWKLPLMALPNPIDPTSIVPFTLNATGEVTGTTNEAGETELSGPMEIRIRLITAPPTPDAPVAALQSYCSIPLPGITLTTGVSTPASFGFVGDPFSEGLEGPGSMSGTWRVDDDAISNGNTIYPDLTNLSNNPNRCQTVSSLTKGLGGVWLAADIAEPRPYPQARIATQGFVKKNVAVRAGKKAVLKLKIRNSGNARGTVTVRVKSNRNKKKGFDLRTKSITVTLNPGQSVRRNVVVRTTKKAKGKRAKITATLSGKSVSATVKGK
jgi:hypothetical protein